MVLLLPPYMVLSLLVPGFLIYILGFSHIWNQLNGRRSCEDIKSNYSSISTSLDVDIVAIDLFFLFSHMLAFQTNWLRFL